jgi:DNA integrity scanning protein DisA with diadenylate cyclase activity/mannitol/fructose-specific phosphotransferase system IIA component (Ntr-type)
LKRPADEETQDKQVQRKLSSYIRPGAVLDLVVDTKEDLLRSLAEVVVEGAGEDVVEEICSAIQEREAAVNTYVGNGVAIPHARVGCIEGISLALARNPEGFPYGIDTDEPVVLACLVVGNESLQKQHVKVLGMIASLVKDTALRDQILYAADVGEVLKLLDSRTADGQRRKARPLTQLLLSHARKIAREMGATAIFVSLESAEALAILKRLPRRGSFIVATSSQRLAERAERVVKRVLLLPTVPLRSDAQIKLAALMALTHGLIQRGDVAAFLSGTHPATLDTMTILEIGREFGRFVTPSGKIARGIQPGVVERVITLATELGAEGREGVAVGTAFLVVGDPRKLHPYCQQMVMNPFHGYPEEERNILDPTLAETIKEFATIDGAFVIRGDGVVRSAGTYLNVSQQVDLPGGYGSRHRAASAMTKAVDCIAVTLSQSTGEVTVFKNGSVVVTLPRSSTR